MFKAEATGEEMCIQLRQWENTMRGDNSFCGKGQIQNLESVLI